MSNLEQHDAEQAEITAACEAGECDHTECKSESWHDVATELFDGSLREDKNEHRAARVALACYPAYDDDTLETMVCDVLSDMRHLCDLMGWNFADLSKGAHRTYLVELAECGGVAKHERLRAALDNDLQ